MSDLDGLLNDQFIVFSQKIAAIHTEKKGKKEAFKKLYDQFTAECKALDDQARTAKGEYDDWLTGKTKPPEQDEHA